MAESKTPKKRRRVQPTGLTEPEDTCSGISVEPFRTDEKEEGELRFVVDLDLSFNVLLDEDATDLPFSALLAQAKGRRPLFIPKIREQTVFAEDAETRHNPAFESTRDALGQFLINRWWERKWESPAVRGVLTRQIETQPGALTQSQAVRNTWSVRIGVRLHAWATPEADRVADKVAALEKERKAQQHRQDVAERLTFPKTFYLMTHLDLRECLPVEAKHFELDVEVTVKGKHSVDAYLNAIPESIKLDISRNTRGRIIDCPEELKALHPETVDGEVEWTAILSEDALKRTYKIDFRGHGYATARVKLHAFIPTDLDERVAEHYANIWRRDKTSDYRWTRALKEMLGVKAFRMQAPVMVVPPADFERIKKEKSLSSFPVGSKWFRLEDGVLEELPSDEPPLLLSEKWKACIVKTVEHHDIFLPGTLVAGPLFICVLADVVPFVADPDCSVPDVVPCFSRFTAHETWGVSWAMLSPLEIPNPEEFRTEWDKDTKTFKVWMPEERPRITQLTEYANQGPFGAAHVQAMLDKRGWFRGTARFT